MKILILSILIGVCFNGYGQCDVPPRFDPNNGRDNWALPCFTGKTDTVLSGMIRKQERYCVGQLLSNPPINVYEYRLVNTGITVDPYNTVIFVEGSCTAKLRDTSRKGLTLDTSFIHGDTLTQVWDSTSKQLPPPHEAFVRHYKITEVFLIKRKLTLLSRKVKAGEMEEFIFNQ